MIFNFIGILTALKKLVNCQSNGMKMNVCGVKC